MITILNAHEKVMYKSGAPTNAVEGEILRLPDRQPSQSLKDVPLSSELFHELTVELVESANPFSSRS